MAVWLGIVVLSLDILTKFFVQCYLSPANTFLSNYPYQGIPIFSDFFGIELSFIHATNRGAAWGILADWQIPLLFVRAGLILSLLIYFLKERSQRSRDIPIVLVLAGAIGNLIDYFFYGHVIDMIHFVFWGYSYPTFNVADTSIFIGGALWLFGEWRKAMTSENQYAGRGD